MVSWPKRGSTLGLATPLWSVQESDLRKVSVRAETFDEENTDTVNSFAYILLRNSLEDIVDMNDWNKT